MKPGIVLSSTGNSTIALAAWIIGGVITLASGLTIAEVSVRISQNGFCWIYKVPLYPLTPIVAILGVLYIVGSSLMNSPFDALLSLAVTLIGHPFILK
ncbi:amino acid transporter [Peribacillus deserti]|uniref:Amino acid transporter n=1 Tax=Peribacillus deserti TaxID=673318 RepID=A0ABS2QLP4_9BACI|nr:amino acid transporter [Peribacillus deserti]